MIIEKQRRFKATDTDIPHSNKNKVKKLVLNVCKGEIIDRDMKKNQLPKKTYPGKVQANPNLHKKNHPIRTIIIVGTTDQKDRGNSENKLSEHFGTYIKNSNFVKTNLIKFDSHYQRILLRFLLN